MNCTALKRITIPASVTKIETSAFESTTLEEIIGEKDSFKVGLNEDDLAVEGVRTRRRHASIAARNPDVAIHRVNSLYL